MKYLYYPGCSLEGTASEYNLATQAFMQATGAELIELEDWTCCGATAADAASRLLSLVLPARNLALAEKMKTGRDLLVPCSACYLNLKKVSQKVRSQPALLAEINSVLAEENLKFSGKIQVRHLLDVLTVDLGATRLQSKISRPLEGLIIAPYYGCQCLRPYRVFDDPESPTSMDKLIEATGAAVFSWQMGPKCCGASHMNTKMEVGLELSGAILSAANGADAIVTVCPMCQMNLEAYQKKISHRQEKDLSISILYLPQLLGLAVGLSEADVKLDMNLAVTDGFKTKLAACQPLKAVAV